MFGAWTTAWMLTGGILTGALEAARAARCASVTTIEDGAAALQAALLGVRSGGGNRSSGRKDGCLVNGARPGLRHDDAANGLGRSGSDYRSRRRLGDYCSNSNRCGRLNGNGGRHGSGDWSRSYFNGRRGSFRCRRGN